MRTDLPILFILAAVLLLALGAPPVLAASPYGEDPSIVWQKLLGGIGNDAGYSIQPTADGGYVLLGYSYSSASGDVTGASHGGEDLWAVKLDGAGAIQWQKLLGGSGYDYGNSIRQTADGGYILLGTSTSSASGDVTGTNHGSNDLWAVKLSDTGLIQWQRLFGGSSYEVGSSIQQTPDGGYVILGHSSSSVSGDMTGTNHGAWDYWVVKLDGAGGIQWQKLLGGSGSEFSKSIRQTADSGYVLFGKSSSGGTGDVVGPNHGNEDYWTVKLDGGGGIQWQKLLGGSGNEEGSSIEQTSDGGYVLTGYSTSSASGDVTGTSHGTYDIWLVNLDGTGAVRWQRLLGGSATEDGLSVRETPDGGYIIVGSSQSSASGDVTGTNHGGVDVWAVKMKTTPGLRLNAGWNFVSVPAVLASGSDTAAIFAGVTTAGHSIFLYNASTKTWTAMTASTKLKVLDGVWIYSASATTVPLLFDTNPQAVPPVKDLAAGWNAIGYSSTDPAYAHDALSPVASKWSTLKGFDALMQRYETSIINGGSGDYSDYRQMLAGKGYWLYMREAGQLAGV